MKRIAFALLALAFVAASLSAQAPAVPELKGKTVEITIWTHEDVNRTAIEKRYIDEFTKANPGVKVNYVTYPSAKIKDIVTAGFAAGNGPDIFNLEIFDAYPFLAEGFVAPVDLKAAGYKSYKDIEAKYVAGMLAPVVEGGKVYGLPLELTNWALFINKKMFRAAGLDPEKDWPKTWEEVRSVSEKIAKRDGQILLRRGFDFRYPYYLTSVVPMVEQLGGELVSKDGKKVAVGDAAWLKVFEYFRDFGPNGSNLGSPTYTAARKAFDLDKDEIAMSLSGLYQIPRLQAANPAFYDSKEWMVVPFPQWKDAKKVVPNNYYGHYYMVSSQESKLQQQASWALVSYMLSHGEEYLGKVGIVQPTKALMESAAFKAMPYSDVFAKDLAKAHIVYYGASSTKIDALLKEAFESVMLSGVEPAKALEKLRKSMAEALADE
ncbi:MAG TPA: extracellular solute-binding protein [Spirochaetales bacterium]|nr:extracellular solute-binding protein [Spirochaetales bacterium]